MPQVSIIVPVYNVAHTLKRCVDSILAQTFTDFELILVDDGSPDASPEICDELALCDHRIHVIHKPNGGLSSARNAGIQAAGGSFILFCDSDDYVHSSWCSKLTDTLRAHPDAWIVSNITKVDSAGNCRTIANLENQDSASLTYYDIYAAGLSPFVWNKIYNLEKIRQKELRFDEQCNLGEDIGFNTEYLKTCSEIRYIPEPLYFYVDNACGIMGTYRANLFELNLPHFATRLPLIQNHELASFCDDYLYYFLRWLDNTIDPRNTMSLRKKMRYNHRMMNTEEFRYCAANATGKNDSQLFMKILRLHNYYVYWLFQKLCAVKAKISRR